MISILLSIQLNSAFLVSTQFNIVISFILVYINTFAHLFLSFSLSFITYNEIIPLLCYFNMKIICTCFNAFINRNHLMIWAIFAPKFLYDACIYITFIILYIPYYKLSVNKKIKSV